MNVVVHTDINAAPLRDIWENLERGSDCFPQSTWAWSSSWWNSMGNGRQARIYVISDDAGRPLALAPFVVNSLLGIKYLRSMPENYGDYFCFLIAPEIDPDMCHELIVAKIMGEREWHGLLLYNVNSRSRLSKWIAASSRSSKSKLLVKTIFTDVGCVSYEEYLQKLSKNRRGYIRKKQRALEATHQVDVSLTLDKTSYLAAFNETFDIQRMRWNGARPERSQGYIDLVKQSNSELFGRGKMGMLAVRANGKLISYRLGFIFGECFYDWNTSYDPEFEDYSPGAISIAYLIREMRKIGLTQVDFMAGFYDYKLSYSVNPEVFDNNLHVFKRTSLGGSFLEWYFISGRDMIKLMYKRSASAFRASARRVFARSEAERSGSRDV